MPLLYSKCVRMSHTYMKKKDLVLLQCCLHCVDENIGSCRQGWTQLLDFSIDKVILFNRTQEADFLNCNTCSLELHPLEICIKITTLSPGVGLL